MPDLYKKYFFRLGSLKETKMKRDSVLSTIINNNTLSMNRPLIFTLLIFGFLSIGCQQSYVPKPIAYPRMELPVKGYQPYDLMECPFEFEIPNYTQINTTPGIKLRESDDYCWMDLEFKGMDAKFHISYKEVQRDYTRLTQLIEDAHKLRAKHIKKADYIDERTIATDNKVYGLFSDIGGNAASQMQFYVTDSVEHFMFGALYFNSTPNYDSIQPAITFIKEDILHLLDSFEWKEASVSPAVTSISQP